MKYIISSFSLFVIAGFSPQAISWDRHDLLTKFSIEKIKWLEKYTAIEVTPFESFLSKVFSKTFTEKDFSQQYQLNQNYKIRFEAPKPAGRKAYPRVGETTTAKEILNILISKSTHQTKTILTSLCPRQELDLYLELRSLSFYPLNYGSNTIISC